MHRLHYIEGVVTVLYSSAAVTAGSDLARRSKTVAQFTTAPGSIPNWAVGFSLFGTFSSSRTFPIGAIVAVTYFIPFYRRRGQVSTETHFEARFGPPAGACTMLCYVLTQVVRTGSSLFGVALVLTTLLGWDMAFTTPVTAAPVTLYALPVATILSSVPESTTAVLLTGVRSPLNAQWLISGIFAGRYSDSCCSDSYPGVQTLCAPSRA